MLSTSATITRVAEAFSLPEMSFAATGLSTPLSELALGPGTDLIDSLLRGTTSTVVNAVSTVLPAAATATAGNPQQGSPQQGNPQQLVPQQVSDPARLATLTGLPLLQQLALLPKDSISDFVVEHPQVVQQLLSAQPAAREVQLWWGEIGIESRTALLESAPYLLGNLEGVPFALRDLANRHLLNSTLLALGNAAEGGRSEVIDSTNQLHMLRQVSAALVTPAGAPARHLLNLDPTASGTAAIVIGDLGAADYVSFLVPGMFYTVDGQMVEWATAAQTFYDAEAAWIDELGATQPQLMDATHATVAWIGYETPSLVNFTSLDLAYEGRDAIAAAINGLRTLRGDDQPYLSLIAHSYGSTAAMMALTDYGIQVDAVGVVGSPGSSAKLASDLGVPGNNVYVGEAPWDQIKDSAFFGSDPGSAAFGAHVFSVDGGTDPLTAVPLVGSVGHNEYFVVGSESIRNLTLVALGQGRFITSDAAAAVAKGSTGYSVSHAR